MHSAPAVQFPVGRSRILRFVAIVGWLLGAAIGLGWTLHLGQPGDPATGLAAFWALWIAAGGLAWRDWHRMGIGLLEWDGQHWSWKTDNQVRHGHVIARLDGQRWLLIEFITETDRTSWLWVHRDESPLRWEGLRRAVYAPTTVDRGLSPLPPAVSGDLE